MSELIISQVNFMPGYGFCFQCLAWTKIRMRARFICIECTNYCACVY